MNIVIVDDHPLMCHAYRNVIAEFEHLKNYQILEFYSLSDALPYIDENLFLLIVDLNLGDDNGMALIQQVRQKGVKAKIIVISLYEAAEIVWFLLKFNITAYITKTQDISVFRTVCQNIHDDTFRYIPKDLNIQMKTLDETLFKKIIENVDKLSPQEKLIMKLKIHEYKNPEIAEILNISLKTLENHITRTSHKLLPPGVDMKDVFEKHKEFMKVLLVFLT